MKMEAVCPVRVVFEKILGTELMTFDESLGHSLGTMPGIAF